MSALQDHYAVILAINHYPGLSNLNGPENDALEFERWLLDPGGGNVERNNVKVIRSSDFQPPASNPDDANPTESQFKKVLNAWLMHGDDWRARVGARLYLFFAGHGFTAQSLTDPALYTAQAHFGDPAHIAGLRYASKIRNAGFFDEIVLFMDCCQDVLKASQIPEPTWSPPDRSARTTMMHAFGAPRGAKAFETDPAAPPARGYFSSVLIDALRTAADDDNGYVTARAVEDRFMDLWNAAYAKLTGYKPPFDAPRDMLLYRRLRPPQSVPAQPAAPPGPGGGSPFGPQLRGTAVRISTIREALGPGVADESLAVERVSVTIQSAEVGAQIEVLGADRRRIADGVAPLRLTLEPGRYSARFRLGDSVAEVPFTADGGDTASVVSGPTLQFSSPAPLDGTSTTHEYQSGPARDIVRGAASAGDLAIPPFLGELFVFARDSAHAYGTDWRMPARLREGLRLHRLAPGTGERVDWHVVRHVDPDRGFTFIFEALPPGTYLLGVLRAQGDRWYWDETVLTLAYGTWRTEVYLDAVEDPWSGVRFDMDSASVLIVPRDEMSTLALPSSRVTEAARLALHDRRAIVDARTLLAMHEQHAAVPPMLALYTAYALTFSADPDYAGILSICEYLRSSWAAHSADVKLLTAWCSARADHLASASHENRTGLEADEVPMLAQGWTLSAALGAAHHVDAAAQYSVGVWRTSGSVWTQTLVPDDMSVDSAMRTRGRGFAVTVFDPAYLRVLAKMPADATLTPLQQMLRRTVIDAVESEQLEGLAQSIEAIGAAAALDQQVVLDQLDELRVLGVEEIVRSTLVGSSNDDDDTESETVTVRL